MNYSLPSVITSLSTHISSTSSSSQPLIVAMKIRNSKLSRKEDVEFRHPFIPDVIATALVEKQFQALNLPPLVEDDVDLSLTLSIPGSRNSTRPILNPVPLRCVPPLKLPAEAELSLALPGYKRKREDNGVKKERKRRDNGGGDRVDPRELVIPSMAEFPLLARALEERGVLQGALFLYRKKLEDSDLKHGQSRLFLTKRDPLVAFLTAEEAAAVDGGGGIKVLGLDERGKSYDLGVKKWPSLKMTVIVSDWNRLATANAAKRGDFVEIWGFRLEGKLGFAVTFRR